MGSSDVTGRTAIVFAIAVTAAAAAGCLWRKRRRAEGEEAEPWLRVSEGGRAVEAERFPEYVARQLGFRSLNECPNLERLASEYLRKVKGCKADMYTFFSNGLSNLNPEKLCQDLIDELDKCILGYFGFHWSHASFLISQALTMDLTTPKKKLKSIVMEATRKIRFERVIRDLKVTRLFSTLVDEMKVMGIRSPDELNRRCTEVMVPADHSVRSPVLLLMGGGMGAGKSTVLQGILKEPFWSGTNPVVVEADAFKETDVIYRALSSRGHHNDMLPTAELVHQSSTNAASSLLVTALNEGRDVIMDGTLSWVPFVEQTITMARSVHRYRYRMDIGYKIEDDGTILENYWEPVVDESGSKLQQNSCSRKPYRIELVGVVCDAYLAVIRGIRRAIMMGRAVRVRSQLQSHKNFAGAFRSYSQLVDNARLYSTNQPASPPMLIAWKDGVNNLLVDPEHINCLDQVSSLNERAESMRELYPRRDKAACYSHPSMWDEVLLSPQRKATQKELKFAIHEVERGQDQGPISTGEQEPRSRD